MNLFALGILTIFAQAPEIKADDLHPAFKKSAADLQAAWDKGEADAPKHRDASAQFNKFRKGIGNIRISTLRHETVSWLWILPPENYNYYYAFDSKKKYRAEEEIKERKEQFIPKNDVVQTTLEVYAELGIYPSFGRAYGRISRHANPNDLKDVRVVLQVGDKIYQPVQQPGDLTAEQGVGSNVSYIPQYEYASARSTGNATYYNRQGQQIGSATAWGNTSMTRQYTSMQREGYNWYRGDFSAAFRLFDKDGNPILKKSDTEFTIIVVYGTNERKATYKLKDLEKPL